MHKFLLVALSFCLLLSSSGLFAVKVPGDQKQASALSTPVTAAQAPSACQALESRLAGLRYLLRLSRAALGDDSPDRSEVIALAAIRSRLQGQISQAGAKMNACSPATILTAPQPRCQGLAGQLAGLRYLLRVSRAALGDDSPDRSVVLTLISTRTHLQTQMDQVQGKLDACLSTSIATVSAK